ncbi:MAG: HAD family hydrolase [Spirochaetales bacterium]|uniref:HAD family hydrolase n=1 Tax=Candidatus Thalassospirochaeta sargassi TaxID=3119039 RepID=A0AAJ1ICG5_9SPIO|nr:HAD family hydrolase [Spirochaetales bacterium]
MKIKGIGFDIDGTLYNNCFMYLCTIPSFLKHPRLVYHYSRARTEIRKIRPIDNFRRTQAELVASSMKVDGHRVRTLIETKLYEDWERSFRIIHPFDGLQEGISGLRTDGYKLGVLSDFPVQNKLKFLGLEDWDCSFTSESTNYLKPHPEPFLELAARLELQPEEILYVGNSYEKDVLGAAAVGMKTAHLSSRRRGDTVADFTFSSFPELFEYIKKMN